MKKKILVLKGLPASGKSKYAKELVAQGWKRVNKDDLRSMIDDSNWSKENEKTIVNAELELASLFLISGYNVVVDDTNFAYVEKWKEFAESNDIDFEVKFFDTPLWECIERDLKRGEKSVGEKVIMRMYNQYLKPEPPAESPDKKDCYIFDIDGTLAKMNGRSPYDYTKVNTDIPNKNIVKILERVGHHFIDIIIMSGREDGCRKETEEWLIENNIKFNALYMRAAEDRRDDRIVKKELYEKYVKDNYNVLAVFDDRNRVVEMWRSLGLTCLQVDYGNF